MRPYFLIRDPEQKPRINASTSREMSKNETAGIQSGVMGSMTTPIKTHLKLSGRGSQRKYLDPRAGEAPKSILLSASCWGLGIGVGCALVFARRLRLLRIRCGFVFPCRWQAIGVVSALVALRLWWFRLSCWSASGVGCEAPIRAPERLRGVVLFPARRQADRPIFTAGMRGRYFKKARLRREIRTHCPNFDRAYRNAAPTLGANYTKPPHTQGPKKTRRSTINTKRGPTTWTT